MPMKCAYLVVLTHVFSLVLAVFVQDGDKHSMKGFKTFETHRAPSTFTKRTIPPSSKHTLNLKIGLKGGDFEAIKKRLVDVSDPYGPLYGQHLTSDEIKKLASPSPTSLTLVKDWLATHGFEEPSLNWSHNRDWVTLNEVPLGKAEEMLNTTYSYYQHNDGETLIRTESYSLPEHIHPHVELVQPTTMFGRLQKKRSMGSSLSNTPSKRSNHRRIKKSLKTCRGNYLGARNIPSACQDPSNVTNACLRELYKTSSYNLQSTGNFNKIGVTAYIGERPNYEDMALFLQDEGLSSQYNFTVISVNGGSNEQKLTTTELARHLGVEANLDIQTTMGITSPMPNVVYTTGGTPPFQADLFTTTNSNEPYLDWLEYMSSQPDSEIPKVISTSYGDDEQTVPLGYARRVCNQLAALGARGVSLIFSSGDNGVGENGTCVSNDGKNTTKFIPIFPATCPYVTSIGATQNFFPEEAVSVDGPGGFPSGGGFSDYFDRPDYQNQQVSSYLSSFGPAYSGMYSRNGRGVPDAAAQGAQYAIRWQKRRVHVGGSSAAAPTFASVIALLNDYRLANGMRPLGFLNPWLYAEGYKGLNDIVKGNSSGCGTPGFPAAEGWDPVTGLGTPNFQEMLSLMPPYAPSGLPKLFHSIRKFVSQTWGFC